MIQHQENSSLLPRQPDFSILGRIGNNYSRKRFHGEVLISIKGLLGRAIKLYQACKSVNTQFVKITDPKEYLAFSGEKSLSSLLKVTNFENYIHMETVSK